MNVAQTLFLQQAQSDLVMFERLVPLVATGEVEVCHALHYLQMATEKLSKAYFAKGGVKRSHRYFSKFWRALLTNNRVRRELQYADEDTFRVDLLLASPLAAHIEALAPDLTDGPNPEYPCGLNPTTSLPPQRFVFPFGAGFCTVRTGCVSSRSSASCAAGR